MESRVSEIVNFINSMKGYGHNVYVVTNSDIECKVLDGFASLMDVKREDNGEIITIGAENIKQLRVTMK